MLRAAAITNNLLQVTLLEFRDVLLALVALSLGQLLSARPITLEFPNHVHGDPASVKRPRSVTRTSYSSSAVYRLQINPDEKKPFTQHT